MYTYTQRVIVVYAIEISLDMIIKARKSSGNFPKLPRIKNDEPFARVVSGYITSYLATNIYLVASAACQGQVN